MKVLEDLKREREREMSELEDCVNLLARAIHRKMHSFHLRHELVVSKDGDHNLRFLQTRNE